MGCAMPSLKTSSTASAVATPSITAYMASFSNGISTRFETNPGASLTSTAVFSNFSAGFEFQKTFLRSSQPANHLHQLHHRHGIKKVHPDHFLRPLGQRAQLGDGNRRSVRSQYDSGRASRSRSRKISALISNFSVAASTMNRNRPACRAQSPPRSSFSADAFSSAVILPFATSRSRFW